LLPAGLSLFVQGQATSRYYFYSAQEIVTVPGLEPARIRQNQTESCSSVVQPLGTINNWTSFYRYFPAIFFYFFMGNDSFDFKRQQDFYGISPCPFSLQTQIAMINFNWYQLPVQSHYNLAAGSFQITIKIPRQRLILCPAWYPETDGKFSNSIGINTNLN